jgi:cellulose synthase (UDP-forming)
MSSAVSRGHLDGGAAVVLPAELPVKDPELTHIGLIMDSERLVIPVQTLRTARGHAFLRFQPLDMAMGRKLVRGDGPRRRMAGRWSAAQVGELRSLNDIIMVDIVTLKRLLRLNFAERKRMKAQRRSAAAQAAALPPTQPVAQPAAKAEGKAEVKAPEAAPAPPSAPP